MFSHKIDERLSLALIQPSFAGDYWALVCQQRDYLSQWLAWPQQAYGEPFFSSFIELKLREYAENKSLTCVIIYDGQVAGSISFNSFVHPLKKASIGYWLSEPLQGQGILTRALIALMDLGFERYQLEKLEIAAATENRRSRAMAERLGFTLEGTIRRAENLNGRIVDHALYGILKEEWQAHKQRHFS